MELIRKIKIKYFRSVYTASLSRCKSMNVVSGRNDAGKSNILKALNLFFNGNTDWGTAFDFYQNFSVKRLQQVRKESVKGKQFISIEIEFMRPLNYKGSLPETFSVTRTWHRDSSTYLQSDNLDTLESKRLIPSTRETAGRFLSQFLNRIHFEYVPAVKDRAYFTHLLSGLQARLLASPLDSSAAPIVDDLASHIQGQIGQLQKDFSRATGLETSIEPPKELASLFQSFTVSTASEGGSIPLVFRGDGIQARYVPSVLHYISSNSNDFFVWGFEEPENSLEYTHITSLTRDFVQTYTKKAQIFITSHSPAFVSLRDENSTCYRAFKENDATSVVCVWPEKTSLGHREALLRELGALQIQEEIHKQYAEKLSQFETIAARVDTLRNEIAQYAKPLLLVEGKYDKQIIEVAWAKLFPSVAIPFIVRVADPAANAPGGGSAGATYVAAMIEAIHPDEHRKAIGLFDYDQEGYRSFQSRSRNFKVFKGKANVKAHRNGLAFAVLLSAPPYRADYATANNLTLEFLFPDNVMCRKTDDGRGLVFGQPKLTVLANQRRVNIGSNIVNQLQANLPGYKTIISGKEVFANEIVANCTPEEFEGFRDLFSQILDLLEIEI